MTFAPNRAAGGGDIVGAEAGAAAPNGAEQALDLFAAAVGAARGFLVAGDHLFEFFVALLAVEFVQDHAVTSVWAIAVKKSWFPKGIHSGKRTPSRTLSDGCGDWRFLSEQSALSVGHEVKRYPIIMGIPADQSRGPGTGPAPLPCVHLLSKPIADLIERI